VNEVKRQAVAELQRAVAAAESKACELVATERAKMEKLLLEARKQAAEEALAAVVVANQQQQQAESSEVVNALPAPSQQNASSFNVNFIVSPCIFYIDLICTNLCTCIYEYNIT